MLVCPLLVLAVTWPMTPGYKEWWTQPPSLSPSKISPQFQPVLKENKPSFRIRTQPSNQFKRSSPSLPCGCNAVGNRQKLCVAQQQNALLRVRCSRQFGYLQRLGYHLNLRGVRPQPPILNQSSVVLRRPAHEAVTTRVRNLGKSKEEPTQFWRRQNVNIRRTPSTKQASAVLVNFLCGQRFSTASAWFNETKTLVLLKSNARRVLTMLVSNSTRPRLCVSNQSFTNATPKPFAERQVGILLAPTWQLAQAQVTAEFSKM